MLIYPLAQVAHVAVAPGCEYGSPGWIFGVQMYNELPDGKILACHYSIKVCRCIYVTWYIARNCHDQTPL